MFNSYVIVEAAGRGAAGQVYRARHNFLGGDYAVKVLRAGQNDPRIEARFLREAQAARKIRHPNVVEVVDFGESDDGTTFLAMEWLDGISLAEAIARDAPFPPSRVADVARQIASGLGAAHALGLIHRDLKPANVMLVGPAKNQVKIVDFGLVRDKSAARLTQPGILIGTPFYMAPELITEGDVGPATDLYALGAMMYEMLTARVPFDSKNVPDIFAKHLNTPAPAAPPSSGLETIIARLLAKDPKDRPQSAAALIALIDAKPAPKKVVPKIVVPRAVWATAAMLIFVGAVIWMGDRLRHTGDPAIVEVTPAGQKKSEPSAQTRDEEIRTLEASLSRVLESRGLVRADLDQLEGASKASLRWQSAVGSGSPAERVEALKVLLDVAATAEIDARVIDAKLAAIEGELAGAGEVRAALESRAADLRRRLAHAATADDRAQLAVAVAALRRDLDLSKHARR